VIVGISITIIALVCHGLAVLAMVGMFLLFGLYWRRLPERMPIHFGIDGKPDNWGSKETSLLVPLLSLPLFGLLIWVSFFAPIDPTPNPEKARAFLKLVVGIMNAEIMLMFFWIEWRMFNTALNKAEGVGVWFLPVMLAVLFGTIFLLVKATPHFTS